MLNRLDPGARAVLWGLLLAAGLWVVLAAIWSSF